MRIVLYQPEIPPNTGNIARLCAALGAPLHLVMPLGFSIDDRQLKRAGLDYWPHVDLHVHPHWAACEAALPGARFVLTSARSGIPAQDFAFASDDAVVLGPETRGLPDFLHELHPACVRIPMANTAVRSLNLSTAAGILLFESLRQTGGLAG